MSDVFEMRCEIVGVPGRVRGVREKGHVAPVRRRGPVSRRSEERAVPRRRQQENLRWRTRTRLLPSGWPRQDQEPGGTMEFS